MTHKGKIYRKHRSTKTLLGCFFLLVIYHGIRAKWKLANTDNCLAINITSVITVFIYLISAMLQLYVFFMNQAFIQGKGGREGCNSSGYRHFKNKRLNFSDFMYSKTLHKQT